MGLNGTVVESMDSTLDQEGVWTTLDIFDARARKVASALAAVAKLHSSNPVGDVEVEFLDVYDRLRDLNARAFTGLSATPEAYCWAHKAYDACRSLADASRTNSSGTTALIEPLLDEFKLLVLGAHAAESREVQFRTPCTCSLPRQLPCSNLLLWGTGTVALTGISNGYLEGSIDGAEFRLALASSRSAPEAPVSLLKQPTVRLSRDSVVLTPYVFLPSRIQSKDREESLELGLHGHLEYLPRIEEACRIMQKLAPDTFVQFAKTISHIGLNDPARVERSQASLSDMPGTFIVSCYENPYVTCDCLIHEYYHNRLFALEEIDRIFEDEEQEKALGDVLLYSPWRASIRPIKGLFHSAYVFIPVAKFWLAVLQDIDEDHPVRRQALDDCVRQLLHLRIGIHLLETHGEFTAHGQAIFNSMQTRVDELIAESGKAGVPRDTTAMWHHLDGRIEPLRWVGHEQPITVRENVRSNILHYDADNSCRDLPFDI